MPNPGSKEWYQIVASMPLLDAETQLKGYKQALLEETLGLPNQLHYQKALTRVNAEITRLHRAITGSQWQTAARNVLSEEDFMRVLVEKRRLENELW